MEIVVIGGVAGGATAAARAHRQNPEANITIYEAGPHISYAACGIPYYISCQVPSARSLIMFTPREFQKQKGVTVKTRHMVREINRRDHQLAIEDLNSGDTLDVSYDRLIIACGAEPVIPSLPGRELEGVFTLRGIEEAMTLRRFLETLGDEGHAVIAGGGAIGLEMAEAFTLRDMRVTLLEKANHILPGLDEDMARIVEKHLLERGVQLVLKEGLAAFTGTSKLQGVETDKGTYYNADVALLSIGIKPRVELARQAGIQLGYTGAIDVDEKMATSAQYIYAAGDCCESRHMISGSPVWIPLGSTANKQGRIAGVNAAGGNARFGGVLGTAILKAFDFTVGRTGLNAREAQKAGFAFYSTKIKASSNSRYYPDHGELHIKLVVEEGGRLLGAQVVGSWGVDKRVDVLATAIYHHMNVRELAELDLAYAPPYSVPVDPIIVAGNVAAKQDS